MDEAGKYKVGVVGLFSHIVRQILIMVIALRQRIVEDTDGQSSNVININSDDDADNSDRLMRGLPSTEAREKFTDYSKSLPQSCLPLS